MPTASPSRFSRGPPELPGLMAASVCMKSWKSRSRPRARRWRPLALTMPNVTVWLRPKELPMAKTHSPTSSASESASLMKGNASSRSIFATATSEPGSVPITFAFNSLPLDSVTSIMPSLASLTRWLLVNKYPSGEMMKPVPRARSLRKCGLRPRGPRRNMSNKSSSKGYHWGRLKFSLLSRPRSFSHTMFTTAGEAFCAIEAKALPIARRALKLSVSAAPVGTTNVAAIKTTPIEMARDLRFL